ncbi:MAG: ABC transporter substrate-binding protein [Bacteroidetes bacterium]|nr:ABC transporter substrate-binding protein [Bacteroidota bacterium]
MQRRQCFDQLNRSVEFNFPPQRIVSLVPSQTELLHHLHLADRVVGITKFCVHPKEWFYSKPKIGGTKNLNIEAIEQLNPDLIIGNKEENEVEGIKTLSEKFPVWMSDVANWESAMMMIHLIGEITGEIIKADFLIEKIENEFSTIKKFLGIRTLYLIWQNPWMAAGKNTFIHSMIEKTGLANVISMERYPVLSLEEIKSISPELVLLSSEPFPFKEKHGQELNKILPKSKIVLVDGEMFSWYGSRLLQAPKYFSSLKF